MKFKHHGDTEETENWRWEIQEKRADIHGWIYEAGCCKNLTLGSYAVVGRTTEFLVLNPTLK
ncbi:hypothetical protein CKA32_005089 [Geitlerinema sp. FC II]|nr:hypothetical protein CKA32_005089 [Geitlerinema sp. FC II]